VNTGLTPAERRQRNPRGEGSRLRQDILEAASRILEATGSEQAVTLRAVARAVGISAPSIYAHFPDREAIVDQLVAGGFAELTAGLLAAMSAYDRPADRLLAACRSYLRYAAEHPRRYRILFHHPDLRDHRQDIDPAANAQGAAALNVLVQAIAGCAQTGLSASRDHFADAVAVWVALHGFATLLAETAQDFPWPDHDQLLTAMVVRLAQLAGPEAT